METQAAKIRIYAVKIIVILEPTIEQYNKPQKQVIVNIIPVLGVYPIQYPNWG